jgi:GAF domain-containing protein/signal transduction histidine kinase
MGRPTKIRLGRAEPGKAAAKLRSAPATRGQAAKPKRPAAAVTRKGAPDKPGRNGAKPDQTLARLRAERDEALAQQAATAEILQIINRSSGDPAPVFDAILKRAMRLCDAAFGGLLVPDGEFIRYVAMRNLPKPFIDFMAANQVRLTSLGPAFRDRVAFHIEDLSRTEGYRRRVPISVLSVETGARTLLFVPLIKEGVFIGAFAIYRTEVRPFSERQIALVESFAAQAVIAMDNARLINETREALEKQTATAEILRVISGSPTDLQPTFDAIAARATRLSGAVNGVVFRFDGSLIHLGAAYGMTKDETDDVRAVFPLPPGRGSATVRAILTRDIVHIHDPATDPDFTQASLVRFGTILSIPMLRDGNPLGAITVTRNQIEPFTQQQIDLLKTFADQAVIAIENVRLFTELRERTRDLQESLEYQTATSDVLKVISRSTFDLQPVLDTLIETAARLCNSDGGGLTVKDGDVFRYIAFHGFNEETKEVLRQRPLVPSRDTVAGRTALEGKIVNIADLAADPTYGWSQAQRVGGVRSIIGVPMLRGTEVIGTFSLIRNYVEPFTERQIELVRTFADQAVIAIENARLLSELRARTSDLQESLGYQTATSDVLKVISRSTFDLQPVLDTLVQTAVRLCAANVGSLATREGEAYRYKAIHGAISDEFRATLQRQIVVPGRDTVAGRVALEGKVIHVADLAADPEFVMRAAVTVDRIGSVLGVPMLREGSVVGTFSLARHHVEPFTERQIELARTFADQAVIAIENARLLTELRESLDRQTATSDVLSVISSSPGELQPVFEAMLENAVRLCGASQGSIFRVEGGALRRVASRNLPAELVSVVELPRGDDNPYDRMMRARATVHIQDIAAEAAQHPGPGWVAARIAAEKGGARTVLWVPLLKDDGVIGAFVLIRDRVRPFSDKEIALLENFAAQAVIAIENARLLTELRESLDRQTATAEILRAIAATPDDPTRALDTIAETAVRMFGAANVGIRRLEGEMLRYVASAGPTNREVREQVPERSLQSDDYFARSARENRQFHRLDIQDDVAALPSELQEMIRKSGIRTAAYTPLTRDGRAIGVMGVNRAEVRPFKPDELELMKGFADQAMIAIENARLLTELRVRTDDLQESLEYQTATSDVLKVISRSTFDLQPVLDTLMQTAARLCNADGGGLTVREGNGFRYVSTHGLSQEFSAVIRQRPYPPNRGSVAGRTALEGKVVQFEDITADPEYVDQQVRELKEVRSALGVPMLRGTEVIGTFSLIRNYVEPFTDRQIELVRTFADQAVIAIENARLLTELRARTTDLQESLEYQTATSDVLKVISRSTFDLQPVLDTLLQTAARLCNGDAGGLTVKDGDVFRYTAFHGSSGELMEVLRGRPLIPSRDTVAGRTALEARVIHLADLSSDPSYGWSEVAALKEVRSVIGVPMLRGTEVVGTFSLSRNHVEPFTERQIELVRAFADQAVIAIENARLLTELRESLDRQTAMSEVLSVISASLGQVRPVFEKLLECALRLCRSHMGTISQVTDGAFTTVAKVGAPPEFSFQLDNYRPPPDTPLAQMLTTKSPIRIDDYVATEGYAKRNPAIVALVEQGRGRSAMQVPMLREDEVVGAMTIYRPEVRPFNDQDMAIAEDFAKQAVIAIDNARLLTELRESLEQQQAMAELLQVINASPGNLAPVYDAILDKAHSLCGAAQGSMQLWDGQELHTVAVSGQSQYAVGGRRPLSGPNDLSGRLVAGESFVHVADAQEVDDPIARRAGATGTRSVVLVPLRKESTLLGIIVAARQEVRPFTDKQIALLQSFAAQAVIAMDNARLLNEIRQRQAELRVTFDNMGDAVIMFDGEQRLVAWNRNFLHMLDIPEQWLASPRSYGDFAAYLTDRGEFGDTPPPDIGAPDKGEVRPVRYERTRPNGRVLEVRRNPIPGGAGFVFIYSDITERKLAEQSILAAREAAERALADLKLAQANLIQSEKMASLGALTAGIAHEIKNPLNFVNNFANLSNELLGELKEAAAPAFATLDADKRGEIDETITMLTGNLGKIQEHGRRADGIVKSMLAHSRGGSGDRREADVNALVEESLNLAYHGARAQDQNFNIALERDYDKAMKPIELVPQDVTRVFLNLCGNGFYAASKRRREGGEADFRPVLKVATRELGDAVEVRIRDNGTGIPPEVRNRLFQPFFTTKPTGEGTGLGLSISYDIVTQQHGGTIAVDSRVGDFTEFTIHLPRKRSSKKPGAF